MNYYSKKIFLYLLALTSFFCFVEILFSIHFSDFYLGYFKFIANSIAIPIAALPAILLYISIWIGLHLFWAVLIWLSATITARTFHFSEKHTEQWALTLWIFSVITLLLANQYFFPNSKFAILTDTFLSSGIILSLLIIAATVWIGIVGVCLFQLLFDTSTRWVTGLLLLFIIVMNNYTLLWNPSVADAATEQRPNIVIIGIDSLRTDFLGYYDRTHETPHIDHFLKKSTVFVDALTPLARTYPAWVSILSGEYPLQHGARSNLSTSLTLNTQDFLPHILKQHGYQTIFATDETRFSNIDQQFGFDKLITPPMGLNDFILGTFNDFPLTNLLVNTRLGQWLFPYSYANRGAYVTYRPQTFLTWLQQSLSQPRRQPVFLAVHFCLPHFPYLLSSQKASDNPVQNYNRAVLAVDQQIGGFIAVLQKNNFLQHAVVILLSDHGEAIELPGDRVTRKELFVAGKNNPQKVIPKFYPPNVENEDVDKSAGHGGDVLGLPQNHIMLAFQLFGLAVSQQQIVQGVASLLDIKPTVLELLNLPANSSSGNSLLLYLLTQNNQPIPARHFIIESDFSPQAVRSIRPDVKQVLLEGLNYYQVDPTTLRVSVRHDKTPLLMSIKQYADFYGQWALAVYPQQRGRREMILVDLTTGRWTNDLTSDFAKKAPVASMLSAIQHYRYPEFSE